MKIKSNKIKPLSERKIIKLDRIHSLLEESSNRYSDEVEELIESFSEADRMHPSVMSAECFSKYRKGEKQKALKISYHLQKYVKPGDYSHYLYVMSLLENYFYGLGYKEFKLFKSKADGSTYNLSELEEIFEAAFINARKTLNVNNESIDLMDFILIQHDNVRLHLFLGEYDNAVLAAEKLLQRSPDFLPARNNVALALFYSGRAEEALPHLEYVIDSNPEYYFALNLRYRIQLLLGKDLSPLTLKTPELSSPGLADMLMLLALDFNLDSLYEFFSTVDYKIISEHQDEFDSLRILNVFGFTEWIKGNFDKAKEIWTYTLNEIGHYDVIARALDSFEDEIFDIHISSFTDFIPIAYVDGLKKFYKEDSQEYVKKHVELLRRMILFGDSSAIHFVIDLLSLCNESAFDNDLKVFVESRRGSFDQRFKAGSLYVRSHGETEFNIFYEGVFREKVIRQAVTKVRSYSPKVEKLILDTSLLLDNGNPQKVEKILDKVILDYPEIPELHNHRMLAKQMLGKLQESNNLVEKIAKDFPDFIFGQINLAKKLFFTNQIEEAKVMLSNLLSRSDLDLDEIQTIIEFQEELINEGSPCE